MPDISRRVRALNQQRAARGLPVLLLHTDAAQALGKRRVDVWDLGVDFLTIVGHKVRPWRPPSCPPGGETHPCPLKLTSEQSLWHCSSFAPQHWVHLPRARPRHQRTDASRPCPWQLGGEPGRAETLGAQWGCWAAQLVPGSRGSQARLGGRCGGGGGAEVSGGFSQEVRVLCPRREHVQSPGQPLTPRQGRKMQVRE